MPWMRNEHQYMTNPHSTHTSQHITTQHNTAQHSPFDVLLECQESLLLVVHGGGDHSIGWRGISSFKQSDPGLAVGWLPDHTGSLHCTALHYCVEWRSNVGSGNRAVRIDICSNCDWMNECVSEWVSECVRLRSPTENRRWDRCVRCVCQYLLTAFPPCCFLSNGYFSTRPEFPSNKNWRKRNPRRFAVCLTRREKNETGILNVTDTVGLGFGGPC